ncbi:hypothetical protein CYLTODRAFT_414845 [Cylindrobasidium torrendii FP15055 ss-10]|uniref:Uncharacterized protein n=1 Tax=Cylindrobasidium torrendii FP15055 ss-10 TaxID=1314674 RepID=A0A0D7AWC4_9AGAR|nr:hypothetical protein CYLTODRAFT_414845 [Cylindrobasidium torrendii FP15055 ss-10]
MTLQLKTITCTNIPSFAEVVYNALAPNSHDRNAGDRLFTDVDQRVQQQRPRSFCAGDAQVLSLNIEFVKAREPVLDLTRLDVHALSEERLSSLQLVLASLAVEQHQDPAVVPCHFGTGKARFELPTSVPSYIRFSMDDLRKWRVLSIKSHDNDDTADPFASYEHMPWWKFEYIAPAFDEGLQGRFRWIRNSSSNCLRYAEGDNGLIGEHLWTDTSDSKQYTVKYVEVCLAFPDMGCI